MKRILFLIVMMYFTLMAQASAASSDIKIYVLGEKIGFEQKPLIVDGTTLVPMRPLFESLGATVTWDESTQTVSGTRGTIGIKVTIEKSLAYINNKEVPLEQPAQIIDGSTYVPLRFIAESFGIDVNWDQTNQSISVGKPYEAKDISKIASGAVVFIETFANNQPFATGSGFITDENGIVVTNYHVIDGATSATVKTTNGRTINVSKVINYDKDRDIAILQLEKSNPLPSVILGDSDKISNGDKIFAIGSPKGLDNTITTGLVSNKNRISGNKPFIQLSAEITHGSSGGALFNDRAEVIGITSNGLDEADLNFAIPINALKKMTGTNNISLADLNRNDHEIHYDDGGYYVGDIKNGEPNGFGTMTYANGEKAVGNFLDGVLNGKGMFFWNNKATYNGDWVSGNKEGFGTDKDQSGNIYEGQFSNNLANGKGTLKLSNGDIYVGDMRNGAMSGYGTYTSANGQSVYGLWSNNKFLR